MIINEVDIIIASEILKKGIKDKYNLSDDLKIELDATSSGITYSITIFGRTFNSIVTPDGLFTVESYIDYIILEIDNSIHCILDHILYKGE